MKKTPILLMVVFILLSFNLAAVGSDLKIESKQAIGFSLGRTGGSGLSYKRVLNNENLVKLSGGIGGNTVDSFSYNLGLMYQKVLDETAKTRLLLAPALTWNQKFDLNQEDDVWESSANTGEPTIMAEGEKEYHLSKDNSSRLAVGLNCGIEFKMFNNIGISIFAGYMAEAVKDDNYVDKTFATKEEALNYQVPTDYNFGLTGDIAISYYF